MAHSHDPGIENKTRLCLLIDKYGTSAMRAYLDNNGDLAPHTLNATIAKHRDKDHMQNLSQVQKEKLGIIDNRPVQSEEFDITLMAHLLKNCPAAKLPNDDLAAIDNIRKQRNDMKHSLGVDDEDVEDMWIDIYKATIQLVPDDEKRKYKKNIAALRKMQMNFADIGQKVTEQKEMAVKQLEAIDKEVKVVKDQTITQAEKDKGSIMKVYKEKNDEDEQQRQKILAKLEKDAKEQRKERMECLRKNQEIVKNAIDRHYKNVTNMAYTPPRYQIQRAEGTGVYQGQQVEFWVAPDGKAYQRPVMRCTKGHEISPIDASQNPSQPEGDITSSPRPQQQVSGPCKECAKKREEAEAQFMESQENFKAQDYINIQDEQGLTPLHMAVIRNDLDMCQELIDSGADVNSRDPHRGVTPLILTADGRDDRTAVATLLLDRGADVNAVETRGWSTLHFAAQSSNVAIAELLLDRGANVNVEENDQCTPLHIACLYKSKDFVALLLNNGAISSKKDNNGRLALHFAAQNGFFDLIELLLQQENVNVNVQDNKNVTPLHLASAIGNLAVVRLFVEIGANVTAREHIGWTPLHFAAQGGHVDIAEYLIQNLADVNAVEDSNRTPLHYAAQNGHLEVAKCFIDSGADVNAKGHDGITPLWLALANGQSEIVNLLMEKSSDFTRSQDGEVSLLHIAALNGNFEFVQKLVESGENVDVKDEKQRTPLQNAAQEGFVEIASYLIDHGADPLHRDERQVTALHLASSNGMVVMVEEVLFPYYLENLNCVEIRKSWTPLMFAVANGHASVAELFINNGADVNFRDIDNCYLLHAIAQNGNTAVGKLLLDAGANPNVVDENRRTPLHHCVSRNNVDLAILFLSKSANIATEDKDKRTPIHFAAQDNACDACQLLLEKGANVNCSDKSGIVPLHLAAGNGNNDICKILLDSGASVNYKNHNLWSPLHFAAQSGITDTGKYLCLKGAEVDALQEHDATPLFLACQNGMYSFVKMLIENGASINLCESNMRSPLHIAAHNGNEHVVALLLRNGADRDKKDHKGRTAFHLATDGGHRKVIKLLLKSRKDIEADKTNIPKEVPKGQGQSIAKQHLINDPDAFSQFLQKIMNGNNRKYKNKPRIKELVNVLHSKKIQTAEGQALRKVQKKELAQLVIEEADKILRENNAPSSGEFTEEIQKLERNRNPPKAVIKPSVRHPERHLRETQRERMTIAKEDEETAKRQMRIQRREKEIEYASAHGSVPEIPVLPNKPEKAERTCVLRNKTDTKRTLLNIISNL